MTHAHLRPAERRRRRGGRAGVLAALGLALVLLLPGTALAAPGDLDPAFGPDGRVTTAFPGYTEGHDIARQGDGKLVVAGLSEAGFALARYNTNGSLDTGFGTGGRTSVSFPGDGGTANAIALQQNGKIVLAGRADDPNSSEANDFGLARFNPNGTVDTGFGGDGFVVTGFGDFDEARGVLVQPDGKIVAACYGAGFAFALARYQGGDGTPTPPPPPPPSADLSVTKTGTATVSIGDRASYTVTVSNSATSTATATGVTLSDTLSGAGVTLTSATPSQGTCTTTATGASCALGSLPRVRGRRSR